MSRADNRFEDIDRDMSSWLVTTEHWGTRFYIADNESDTATDIIANAKRYRWKDQAEDAAKRADVELASWHWESISVAEAIGRKGGRPFETEAEALANAQADADKLTQVECMSGLVWALTHKR